MRCGFQWGGCVPVPDPTRNSDPRPPSCSGGVVSPSVSPIEHRSAAGKRREGRLEGNGAGRTETESQGGQVNGGHAGEDDDGSGANERTCARM